MLTPGVFHVGNQSSAVGVYTMLLPAVRQTYSGDPRAPAADSEYVTTSEQSSTLSGCPAPNPASARRSVGGRYGKLGAGS
jgi:hypothetical protein